MGDGRLDLAGEDRPDAVVETVDGTGVDVEGVEHGAPQVVLALVVGGVADADGPRPLVAAQVLEDLLVGRRRAVDAVHHLEVGVAFGHVGKEPEEVVGLPVEAERVQAPQGEGRVADPAVAVVPVALALGRLRERRGGGRHDGAGRRERHALQGEGAALEVGPPRMIGEVAAGQPVLPVVCRPDQPPVRLVERRRRLVLAPRQGAEAEVTFVEEGARRCPSSLEADPHVGRELELDVDALAAGHALVILVVGVGPRGGPASVVEHGLAVELDLDLAVHAADGADQHVVGVVIGGGPTVGAGELVLVVPGTDQEHVADDDPARRRAPAGLEAHGAGEVAARGRHLHVGRSQPEAAGVAVEDGAEHAGRVHPGQAQPLDVAARRDEGARLTVGEKPVVGDRRERRTAEQRVRRERRRHPSTFPHVKKRAIRRSLCRE